MTDRNEYRICPKCGLNYISGRETLCKVCVTAIKPYRGKYCKRCGSKSGMYDLCRQCHRTSQLSGNEQRTLSGYRTDSGMLGTSTRNACQICGVPTYGKLCGKCYMATRYVEENETETDED